MPIKKPRGLRGLVLLAMEWSRDSGLLARATAHRNHGEGESAEEEAVGRGLRDGGGGVSGDDPRTIGGAGEGNINAILVPKKGAVTCGHVTFQSRNGHSHHVHFWVTGPSNASTACGKIKENII